MREEARVGDVGRLGEDPAEALGPGVLEPAAVARTDMLMSVGWVSTPSSPNRRSRLGYVLRLCTMNPLSMGHDAPVGGLDVVGVRVAAEAGLGLVERDVVLALQHVRGGEPGDTGADDRDPTPRRVVHASRCDLAGDVAAPRGACELERAFERRVVGDGGDERGREPVPGGGARAASRDRSTARAGTPRAG